MNTVYRKSLRNLATTAFAFLCLVATAVVADEPAAKVETASVRPGINDNFLKSDLDIEEWLGRFEIESREVFSAREKVLKELKIEPGFEVADIGAGTGFYSRLMAAAVGKEGQVYAVDRSEEHTV